MQGSKLHIHSHGIVAVNKPLDTDLIEVWLSEHSPFADGEVTDNIQQATASGKDASGAAYSSSIDTTLTVQAKWLPIGMTNRKTSPDVRRGETVVIYRYGDQDKYYWTTLAYDMKLRKLETAVFAFSNTTDESADGSSDNTYYLEFSTHRSVVTLHTSKSNGEPFTYDIQINAKDGNILITDDAGNFMSMDSANVRLELMNSAGSHYDANQEIITITAPDTINLIAQRGNINMTAGTDITHKADNNITSQAGNDITVNASNDITTQAGSNISTTAGSAMSDHANSISTQASSTTNTVPNTTFTGIVNIDGMLNLGGGVTASANGGFSVGGGGQFHGPVHVTQLTSDSNIVAPNVD